MEIRDPGVQTQELLSASTSSEPLLTSLLSPCRSMFLLNQIIAAHRGDHLPVVDVNEARDLSNHGTVASQLIRVDHLWDVIFIQQPRQKSFCRFGVSVPLKQNVKHETVLVDTPPQPVSDAIYHCADLIQIPPGTPPGFPVAQFFNEQRAEFHAPLAQRFVANPDAALVQQFLHVTVTQGEAVVQPRSAARWGDTCPWPPVAACPIERSPTASSRTLYPRHTR